MHIAQFVQRYPPARGGSEAYTARLCNYLADCGDNVTVWTTTAIELQELWTRTPRRSLKNRIVNHRKPVNLTDEPANPSVRRYPLLSFPARRYVLKALSLVPIPPWQCLTLPCNPVSFDMMHDARRYRGPLDAVHATAFPYAWPILCALRLARRHGVPFLLTPFLHIGDPHNTHDRTRRQYTQRCLRWLLRQADRVFVQTMLEQQVVVELGVPNERVVVQGLGVDPAECTDGDREGIRSVWGVQPDEIVIGHLANNSVEKGTVDLLKAAVLLANRKHPIRIVLAGPEMPNFRRFWADYSWQDGVIRLGILTDPQKRDFFAGIDVFCLPSRSDSFGLVLLEAWATRKPVVVYRAGGPAEIVRHRIDGFIADCNVTSLVTAIEELVTNRYRRFEFGEAGWQRVKTKWCWSDKLHLFRRVVCEAVQSQRRDVHPAAPFAGSLRFSKHLD
jgi:glycosyltransferase involved in cell wall biosynthesis